MLLGDRGSPWIVTLRGAYRGEPSDLQPANPEFTGTTSLQAFPVQQTCPPTCGFFSTLPGITFGNPNTLATLDQQYTSFSANANKLVTTAMLDLKFGWQFLRTKVDGLDLKH